MCVGQKIKTYIEKNGLKQSYIADSIGMSVTKLNLSLNGNRRLTFDEYELICGALGVGTDKFIKPRTPKAKEQSTGDRN